MSSTSTPAIDSDDGVPHVKTITIGGRVVENRLRYPIRIYADTDPSKKPVLVIDVTQPPLLLNEDKVVAENGGQAVIRELGEDGTCSGEHYPHLIPIHRVRYSAPSSNEDDNGVLPDEESGRGYIVTNIFPTAYPGRKDLWGVNAGREPAKVVEDEDGQKRVVVTYGRHGAVLDPNLNVMIGTTGLIYFGDTGN